MSTDITASELPPDPPATLCDLIDRLRPDPEAETLSVTEAMHRIGDGSFAPVVLAVALVLVSPLSAIPGMPTLGGITILLVTAQWVLGRRHLWLPGWLVYQELD